VICVVKSQHIARILYQSMLEPSSRSDERHPSFSGKADRAQRALHTPIRTTCSTPDCVAFSETSFDRSIVDRIGVDPQRYRRDAERAGSMRDGLLRRDVIVVL
jgi:hypothetical protein